jgi:hypothetical protein
VADVDAELERARGNHAEHVARAQALLHLAAAQGQVAAAIAADHARITRLVLDAALDGGEQHLGGEAALGEDDGGDFLLEELDGETRRLAEIGRADAQLGIDHGRVVAEEELLSRRGPLSVTSPTASPVRRSASSRGLAMVADAMMNCGEEP